ncbi:MAG: hypothetical protein ACFE0O_00125 [Opitutales bacterium]
MAGFDENIVREYFELNGFLVRQLRKYQVQSRKKRSDEEIDLVVYNPNPEEGTPPGFQIFSTDIQRVDRAIVVVKGWHTARFTPQMLRSSSQIFNFLKKEVLDRARDYFAFEPEILEEHRPFMKILVLPGLPGDDLQRDQSVALLKERGIDAIITFRTMLENILRRLEPNQSYAKSDLLQLLRILKVYDMVKDPQLEMFKEL